VGDIPEAQDAFQIVRNWIPQLLYALKPEELKTNFLTFLMRLGGLAISFDKQKAASYLHSAPCLKFKSPELLRNPNKTHIVEEFLHSLAGRESWCVSAGILVIRLVLPPMPQ
jgi:hypothetical protein